MSEFINITQALIITGLMMFQFYMALKTREIMDEHRIKVAEIKKLHAESMSELNKLKRLCKTLSFFEQDFSNWRHARDVELMQNFHGYR